MWYADRHCLGGGLGSGGGATTPPRHGLIGWPTISDGEGKLGGGGRELKARVGGEVSKSKNTPVSPSAAVQRFFSEPRILLLMTIEDSPLLGQSASGLNFYDHSERSPIAIKSLYFFIFPSASGLKLVYLMALPNYGVGWMLIDLPVSCLLSLWPNPYHCTETDIL